MKLKPIILHKVNTHRAEPVPDEACSVLVHFTLQLNGTSTPGVATVYQDGTYIEAFWSRPDTWLDTLTCTRLQALTWSDFTLVTNSLYTNITDFLGRETCDHYQSTRTTRSSFLQAPA
jgi:hypothetical protein